MVDTAAVLSQTQHTRAGQRTEPIDGEDMHVVLIHAILPVDNEPVSLHDTRDGLCVGGQVHRSVRQDKVPTLVVCQLLTDPYAARLARHQSRDGCIRLTRLIAREGRQREQVVQRAQHLHIRIHINATVLVQRPQTHHIGHESELTTIVGLASVWVEVEVESVLVPQTQLIVRQVTLPTIDTVESQRWHLTSAKPAIMYNLRNHDSLSLFTIRSHALPSP